MLSPHEFATLLLLKDAPDQLQLDRAELDTLLERQLVTLERIASGNKRAQLTTDSLLQAVARMHLPSSWRSCPARISRIAYATSSCSASCPLWARHYRRARRHTGLSHRRWSRGAVPHHSAARCGVGERRRFRAAHESARTDITGRSGRPVRTIWRAVPKRGTRTPVCGQQDVCRHGPDRAAAADHGRLLR